MPALAMNTKGGLITIELRIGGRPYDFILDTACNATAIVPHLIPFLSPHFVRHHRMDGHGGSTHEPLIYGIKFNFIGISIAELIPANDQLLLIGKQVCGDRFGGLIGLDILQQFHSVEFDFANRKVIFNSRSVKR